MMVNFLMVLSVLWFVAAALAQYWLQEIALAHVCFITGNVWAVGWAIVFIQRGTMQ